MTERPPGHCILSHSVYLATPFFWQAVRAAPAKGRAHQAVRTAGYHGHIMATAASLGSVLLGPEAWPWGFRHLLTLEQRESDLQVTPALTIVCCGSPSCLEKEGISQDGVNTGLKSLPQDWLLSLSSNVHWALYHLLPLDMPFP